MRQKVDWIPSEEERRHWEDVRKQSHYAYGIEPIDYMRSRFTAGEFRGYLAGNVIKYLSRFRGKDGVKDLEKAKVYLDWLIEHEGKDIGI
jgi:hypothetical protein